jgi:hypothetical protein
MREQPFFRSYPLSFGFCSEAEFCACKKIFHYFPLHPSQARHRIPPTVSVIFHAEESLHAHAQLKLARDSGRRDIHDGGGIPVVLAGSFRESVDARNGLRPE